MFTANQPRTLTALRDTVTQTDLSTTHAACDIKSFFSDQAPLIQEVVDDAIERDRYVVYHAQFKTFQL